MDDLFLLLFLLSFLALIIGIFKPRLVIRWGEEGKKTRKNVFKYYGLALIAFFILFGFSIPDTEGEDTKDVVAEDIEQKKEDEEEVEVEEIFELSDSDKNLLKGSYDEFDDEQISRLEEIEENYESLNDEDLIEEIKLEIARLNSEKLVIIEAKKAEEKAKAEEEAKIKAAKEEEERIKAEKEAEERAKAEKEKYNTGITTRDIARDKDGLIGSFVKFSGRIIQVMNGNGYVQYRMAVNDDYDQVIFIEISEDKLESNILEDDYITIEGFSAGNMTYTTVLGAEQTIPAIIVDNFYY